MKTSPVGKLCVSAVKTMWVREGGGSTKADGLPTSSGNNWATEKPLMALFHQWLENEMESIMKNLMKSGKQRNQLEFIIIQQL